MKRRGCGVVDTRWEGCERGNREKSSCNKYRVPRIELPTGLPTHQYLSDGDSEV